MTYLSFMSPNNLPDAGIEIELQPMGQAAAAFVLDSDQLARQLDAFTDDWAAHALSSEAQQAIELQQYILGKEVGP